MDEKRTEGYEAFPIQDWLDQYVKQVRSVFGDRIVCIGLQGSYGRGEATPQSDIDMVVILDTLTFEDLKLYDAALAKLPHREMACGFLSGMREIRSWEKADLFQFYHDTTPLYRDLEFLKDLIRLRDVRRAVLTGACNLYHAAVHNALHERSSDILKGLMKSACFILQAKYYCETGRYVRRRSDLASVLHGTDGKILTLCLDGLKTQPTQDSPPSEIKEKASADSGGSSAPSGSDSLDQVSRILMDWAGDLICAYGS